MSKYESWGQRELIEEIEGLKAILSGSERAIENYGKANLAERMKVAELEKECDKFYRALLSMGEIIKVLEL